MKKWIITTIIIAVPAIALAADAAPAAKLPYAKGQNFVVTQGYNTPPTHIKKDSYALDFTQNGCDAYGKAVVAAASGTAMFLSQEGYNGGYGTELIIDHGNNVVSRYAHMIPGSITVAADGAAIRQGQTVGLLGDTGLVAGAACTDHPGTHLHFAMDIVNADGTFSAYDPEPISGYTSMLAGKWYLSDNGEDDADSSATPPPEVTPAPEQALDVYASASSSLTEASSSPPSVPAPVTISSSTLLASSSASTSVQLPLPPVIISGGGGVSVVSGNTDTAPASTTTTDTGEASDTTSVASSTNATSTTGIATSTTDTSTSTDDISTSTNDTATSTTDVSTSTVDTTSTTTGVATSSPSSGALFQQLDDSTRSAGSWYGDNWFDLGNGFSGTLNALTFEGYVNGSDPFASHVALQEFKDKNYGTLIQQFPISDNAPFTSTMATTTFDGLSIPLKPYFYYRLTTVQDRQNMSVILAGTATTTDLMMWDWFIYGTGLVEYTQQFFPFMIMSGVAPTSTLTPPPLTTPGNLAVKVDPISMELDLSFSTSTDPDWPANPLHYQINYSTTGTLSDANWTSLGSILLPPAGSSYLIGVRAADNYGNVSAPATTTWTLPSIPVF